MIFIDTSILIDHFRKMDKTKTSINTSSIPNGNYFLHVANGKDVVKKQIIIKHK